MKAGRYRWWIGGVAALAIAAGALIWGFWPHPASPRARHYLAFTACLLTDAQGITGAAAPAWQGMQDASLATQAKVQYLSVVGPTTPTNAAHYLASLIQRHCDVIVAVGPAQIAAASSSAAQTDSPRFILVGDQIPASGQSPAGSQPVNRSNITVVSSADANQIRQTVRDTIESAVHA